MCWGPLGNSRNRCRLDGAIRNRVGGGSERGEETDSDSEANAEYGATHVEDYDDEVQNETEVCDGSESVKVGEVSCISITVSKTESVLYADEPGVSGNHRTNSKLSLVQPYVRCSLFATNLNIENGISPDGCGSWKDMATPRLRIGSKYQAEPF